MNATKRIEAILQEQYRPNHLTRTTPSDCLCWAMNRLTADLANQVYEMVREHKLGINEAYVLAIMARFSLARGYWQFCTEGSDGRAVVKAAWKLEKRGLLVRDQSDRALLYLAQ